MSQQVEKSDAEWKVELSPAQFRVLRKEGTERAGTGPLDAEKRDGVFRCAGCHSELFSSEHKYDSGTGWSSFYDVYDDEKVGTKKDRKLFMVRTEVHCDVCGGHLGHVFEDGPEPTGLRYCLNSAALEFQPEGSDDVVPGAPDA
jgi:peptide-methionine (R)-S-oxide reductase